LTRPYRRECPRTHTLTRPNWHWLSHCTRTRVHREMIDIRTNHCRHAWDAIIPKIGIEGQSEDKPLTRPAATCRRSASGGGNRIGAPPHGPATIVVLSVSRRTPRSANRAYPTRGASPIGPLGANRLRAPFRAGASCSVWAVPQIYRQARGDNEWPHVELLGSYRGRIFLRRVGRVFLSRRDLSGAEKTRPPADAVVALI
jgi:hypothetical protein